MTSTHIAQPGPPYAPTGAGVPTTAASFAKEPVAPVQAPLGGLPTPNHYIATPGTTFAPSHWASATPCSINTLYPVGNPHATPGYTYQHQPPQLPPIATGGNIPMIAQAVRQRQQPYTYTAPPSQPSRVTGPYPAMPTHAMAPPAPPFAPPPARSFIQSSYSPPPPPSRSIPPRRGLDTIDLSLDVPLPPPSMPVYSPYPFHPPFMDETGFFSKESQRIIDRFSTKIGGRDLSRRFQGIVNPETVTSLDMTNDSVISTGKFRFGFASLPSWALPVDQPGRGGQPSMPLKDERTPVRVAVLLKLLPDYCNTKKDHEQNATVTVPTIDISQIHRLATDLTAIDLLRVFIYVFTEPGLSKITALAVRNQLHLLPGERWMPVAHRTLMHTRAANIRYYKPHAAEKTYYWRTVAGDQLKDHCEWIIGVLNPSDKNPFHPVVFNLRSAIRDDLNRWPLNEGQLLLDNMVNRGITTHTIYENFLKQISHPSQLYLSPLTVDSQPPNTSHPPTRSPRQRLSAVATDRCSRPPISPMQDTFDSIRSRLTYGRRCPPSPLFERKA